MAQRLKKKLDNMGIDPSSSRLNENFCLIGTPLPSLASTKDANEFVPVWKQEVRDEKGRRRLHGAFTGGFSAGYFNTVGSKEGESLVSRFPFVHPLMCAVGTGWTPATFKSSRTNRASQKTARPEDFMDEEDLAELRDSQKLVDTTEPSASFAPPEDTSDIAGALQSLTLPASDSPGGKLLRKMGWKPGQGIGPRISYARRRQQDIEAGVVKQGAPEDTEASKHLFAPRDTPVLLFRPKENAHGLGHTGPGRLGGEASVQEKAGPNISAGFGLGALNDADDDDIDVYDPGAISRTTRMAYDELDDTDADGHSRRRPLTLNNQSRSQPALSTGGRVASGPAGKFHDGRLVLSGFALSETPPGQDEWFPLPDVPNGWTPDPRRVWTKFAEKGEDEKKPAEVEQGGWKKAPTAQERGAQLGEPTLPQPKKSVFDYLSQKDRDRLQNFRKGDAEAGPTLAPPPKPAVKPRIAPTTAPTAKAALLGFQPFTTDPLRQARYTAYLQYHASPIPLSEGQTPPGLGLLQDQNAEQFNKEMEDYAKAAAIFKPVSGAMAGRFVGASSGGVIVGGGPSVGEGGLYQPTFEKKEEDSTQTTSTIPIEERDPKKNAARHGMYGPLTHEVQPWYPHRLLCKRFGVRDPHPDGPPTAAAKTWEEQVGVAPTAPPTVDLADVEMRPLDSEGDGKVEEEEEDLGPRDLSNVGLGEDPHQGRDTLTYVRPSMDVFKAIFASDEEDSEDEGEQGSKQEDRGKEPVSALDVALRPAPTGADATGPVDLATFRPVFNIKSKPRDKDKEKDKKKDKKKDKSKRAVLSFDVDEGADAEDVSETTKAKSKSKRRDREKDKPVDRASKKPRTEDEEGEWVEKPPPASVLGSVQAGPATNPDAAGAPPSAEGSDGAQVGGTLGSTRTRKRAIDFM